MTPTAPAEPRDNDEPSQPEIDLPEADDADLAEQAIPLPDDEDDDYPHTGPDE